MMQEKKGGDGLIMVNKLKTVVMNYDVPKSFFMSLEDFCIRNAINVDVFDNSRKKEVKTTCLQCFKAFMVDKAGEFNLPKDLINNLASKVNSKIGHIGHYLDEGTVKTIHSLS